MAQDSSFTYTYSEYRPGTEPQSSESIMESFENERNILVYPNPVTAYIDIAFHLEKASEVSIELYNTLGSKVQQLAYQQTLNAGKHELEYNTYDVNPGVYIVKITIDNEHINRVIIKK